MKLRIKQEHHHHTTTIEQRSSAVRQKRAHADKVSPWVISTAIGWIIIVVTCCWYIHRRLREISQARGEQQQRNVENNEEGIKRQQLKSNPSIRMKVIHQTITQKIVGQNINSMMDNIIENQMHNQDSLMDKSKEAMLLLVPQQLRNNDGLAPSVHTNITADADNIISIDMNQSTLSFHHAQDYLNEISCSVCLEPFVEGDILSWSKMMRCKHIFHFDCLVPWLLKKNCCPLCRVDLIKDIDFDKEEVITTTNAAGQQIVT